MNENRNKKKKTLRLYLLLTILLTAVGTGAQTYALLFDYDVSMSVYRSQDGVGVVVGWVLFAFVLILGSALFLLPKETEQRPLPPCGNALAFVAAVSGAAVVGSSLIIALDAAEIGGSIGIVSFLMALISFPAGAYLLLMALFRRENETALSVLGFFPVIWLSLGLMRIYFDRNSAINDPVKTLLQISLAAIMLYFLAELRTRVGKGGFRLRFAFGSVALLLGFASSVSMLALVGKGAHLLRGEVLLAVAELLLSVYIACRLMTFYGDEPIPSPAGTVPGTENVLPKEETAEEAPVSDGKTAAKPAVVVVLAGQSNAVGVGHADYLSRHFSGEELEGFFRGYDDVRIRYYSHNKKNETFDRTTLGCSELNRNTFGPEVGIADALTRRYPGQEIFIVKCAFGATSLEHDWAAPCDRYRALEDGTVERPVGGYFDREAGWCLDELIALLGESLTQLEEAGYTPSVRAFCWMQGESDADTAERAAAYGERYRHMIDAFGERFAPYLTDCVHIDGGIADWLEFHREVNDFKRAFASEGEDRFFLDTVAAGLTTKNEPDGEPDVAHYDSDSVIKLGRLFADKITLS